MSMYISDFCLVLTIIFVVLKACGLITWSWLWVLSPLWILPIIILGTILLIILAGIILTLLA